MKTLIQMELQVCHYVSGWRQGTPNSGYVSRVFVALHSNRLHLIMSYCKGNGRGFHLEFEVGVVSFHIIRPGGIRGVGDLPCVILAGYHYYFPLKPRSRMR